MNLLSNLGTNTAIALSAAIGLILLYLLLLRLRNPVLVRLGLRNIPRRPTQSVLIVVGLALSTIIIVSALSTGDTLTYSLQRQAVAAYGEIDEILAPPLLSLIVSFSNTEGNPFSATDTTATSENQQALQDLTAGGLTTVLTVLQGGLPGITMDRYEQLRTEAADDPLIDRVAASILFPTIIRNTNTGQGEPLGFIFAVDNDYDQSFGLHAAEGEAVEMEQLKPGVGNIFTQASNLFAVAGDLAQQAGINVSPSNVAVATAAVGAALTAAGSGEVDLSQVRIPLDTIDQLGIDTTPLRDLGLTELSLAALGVTSTTMTTTLPSLLTNMGVPTDTVDLGALGLSTATISSTLPSLLSNMGVTTSTLSLANLGLGNTSTLMENILSALNLNTLGSEMDRILAQFGLQLRQGDVYLNRLGADQLNARVGDVLDVYVGPIPIPFRVKAIVDEAGPLGALFPVVMLRLDEAQKLLFMEGKVNNILVSNQGDELGGLQYTSEVSQHLRVLAMDETALNQVVAILRRPNVQPILVAAARDAQQAVMEGFDGPQWVADLIQQVTPMGGMVAGVRDLGAALTAPGISPRLREILGDTTMRGWLLEQNLPADAKTELSSALADLNTFDVIDPLSKSTLLTIGTVGGGIFASVFSLFGFFSILAGILLIFLIFVMLATERRSEMGMARAIGVQRLHLVQMFVVEGMVYDLLAAAIGVALGLAVTYGMVGFMGDIFNNLTSQLSSQNSIFRFYFHAAPTSIVIAYCLGVLLTFIVVTLAAWRVSRLNIVSAIRNLPQESEDARRSWLRRIWTWGSVLALTALGAYLLQVGLQRELWSVLLAAGTFLLIGISLLVNYSLELTPLRNEQIHRWVYSVIGVGLLLIWTVPWSRLLPQWTGLTLFAPSPDQTLLTLALGGPLIILGAILTVTFNAGVLTWFVGIVLGGVGQLTPVLKTAIAYPLSARFRTGMTMLMFAMIISTVVVMAVVIRATQTIVVLDVQETAGFEVRADTTLLSFFSPVRDLGSKIAELVAAGSDYPQLQNVTGVGAFSQQSVQARPAEGATWSFAPLAGVDSGYVTQAAEIYHFQARSPGFADDAAVWQALRERDDVAIITPALLAAADNGDSFGNGAPEGRRASRRFRFPAALADSTELPELFIELRPDPNPDNPFQEAATLAAPLRLQVIGLLSDRVTLADAPLQVNLAVVDQLNGTATYPSSFYIKVSSGADVHAVAQEVERAFIGNGINATVLAESFAQGQAFTRGILQLFQGFMALGLLVGIAALGVITSRMVVERRQQVGVLRAIGYQSRMIAFSFLLEASFIAITGMIIGTVTGIVLGESIIRSFFTTFTPDTTYSLPWGQIAVILLVAYIFSLLTTIVPAYQAANTYPAEALRYE
ncbi:MAG: FtsX-like permease family protein [Caldilineaceae bacterium]